jgi:DNA-binding NarL/FixJ family response regulator
MHELELWLDRARAAVGNEASGRAWLEGLALSADAAIDEALTPESRPPEPSPASGLTRRETEVLRLLAAGQSNKEIATHLQLSVATVERHVANVYAKLGVHTRAAAAVFAAQHRLLDP